MTHSGAPTLEAEGLSREFGSIQAVQDLSFRVERGEIVGLLGPNGAGKTTTLRMLTGSLLPTRGRVRLSGRDPIQEGAAVRRQLGYMPEQISLYGEMTVREYLGFIGQVKAIRRADSSAALQRVRDRLDLGEVWERPTRAISRGYRQRVGLAQALLGDPELLILDEPTTGLDPNQIREFREFLRLLGREHAVILSTHILPEALQVCDRVIILSRGRLAAMGRPGQLGRPTTDPRRIFARFEIDDASGELQGGLEAVPSGRPGEWVIEGSLDPGEDGAPLLRHLLDRGARLLEWRMGEEGLEEVFRRLTLGEEDSP